MNYEIIKNEKILQDYINDYLPDLLSGETYFIRLISRKKYVPSLNSDIEIKAFPVNKEDIISSIKQLECEVGSYMGLDNNGYGIYLNPNPRSYEKYTRYVFLNYSRLIEYGNYRDPFYTIWAHLKNSCSRKIYFDIDFDNVNVYDTIDKVLTFINPNCLSILPTKGGVHFLIKLDDVDTIKYPNWHKNISKIEGYDSLVSNTGDNMIPIPGCNHFGFVPTFIK